LNRRLISCSGSVASCVTLSHAIRNHQNSRKRQRAEVDIEALEAFKSSVTYDPFQALANWDLFNKVERRLQMWSIFMLHVGMKGVNWDLFNREIAGSF